MEDDNSDESELVTFDLELTPWQLYSLNTILQYNMINMQDPMYSTASQVLAKEVHDTIASEKFIDAMDDQKDVFEERREEVNQGFHQTADIPGHGVQ